MFQTRLRPFLLCSCLAGLAGCATAQEPGQDQDLGGQHNSRLTDSVMKCFFMPGDPTPAATVEYVLEVTDQVTAVHTRLTFSPDFVDNSYGANAIGWQNTKKGTHSFKDLVGSDHAQLIFSDANGSDVLDFKMDYLSEESAAPSGYTSLGVNGGDGKMILGPASAVFKVETSLATNFNSKGYGSYTEDSPATDSNYTPNPAAADWKYIVVYDVWIDPAVFGASGFGNVRLDFVHASPSKIGQNSVPVEEALCVPNWCPGGVCEQPDDNVPDPPPAVDCGDSRACGPDPCPDGFSCVEGCCAPVVK